jgi:hypothetical protein
LFLLSLTHRQRFPRQKKPNGTISIPAPTRGRARNCQQLTPFACCGFTNKPESSSPVRGARAHVVLRSSIRAAAGRYRASRMNERGNLAHSTSGVENLAGRISQRADEGSYHKDRTSSVCHIMPRGVQRWRARNDCHERQVPGVL